MLFCFINLILILESGENKLNSKKNVGFFVLGTVIGIGVGILIAPKSGKETRQEVKEKLEKLT